MLCINMHKIYKHSRVFVVSKDSFFRGAIWLEACSLTTVALSFLVSYSIWHFLYKQMPLFILFTSIPFIFLPKFSVLLKLIISVRICFSFLLFYMQQKIQSQILVLYSIFRKIYYYLKMYATMLWPFTELILGHAWFMDIMKRKKMGHSRAIQNPRPDHEATVQIIWIWLGQVSSFQVHT